MLWQQNQDAVMSPTIDGYTYQFHRQVDFRDMSRKSDLTAQSRRANAGNAAPGSAHAP